MPESVRFFHTIGTKSVAVFANSVDPWFIYAGLIYSA